MEYRYKFDTIGEILAAINAPHVNARNARAHHYKMDNPNWICADRPISKQDDVTYHLGQPLFAAGVRRIEAMSAKLSAPTPTTRRRQARWTDQGDELDMQRVWQGDLDHAWRRMARESTTGPSRVLIAVCLAAYAHVSAETLAIRGTAALALAQALQNAGYCVGIVGGIVDSLQDGRGSKYTAEVQLLAPGDAIDIHKLASLVASGLLFRGVFLDHMLRVSKRELAQGVSKSGGAYDASCVNASGYDYVAMADEGELDSIYSAQQWLNTHLGALSPSDSAE